MDALSFRSVDCLACNVNVLIDAALNVERNEHTLWRPILQSVAAPVGPANSDGRNVTRRTPRVKHVFHAQYNVLDMLSRSLSGWTAVSCNLLSLTIYRS